MATTLTVSQIDVWIWSLDTPDRAALDYRTLLSSEERNRIDHLRTAQARNRAIAARAGLRRIISRYLDEPASKIALYTNPTGKPQLANPGIYFNLSHTEATAALAVTSSGEVGIDIETRRVLKTDISRAFSPREQVDLASLPAEEWNEAIILCWTRKEAVVKALGFGLGYDLSSFTVSVGAADPPRLLAIDDPAEDPATWSLHNLEPSAGIVGTVAVRAPQTHIKIHHADGS